MIDVQNELSQARSKFLALYSHAELREAMLIDSLVLARAALILGISAPRDVDSGTRRFVDEATDQVERKFMALCDQVRETTAFQAVSSVERARVEKTLFRVELT